jgi:hypothetical protein
MMRLLSASAVRAFMLCTTIATSARAEAPDNRWSLEIGQTGTPGHSPDIVLYASASARLATTGPLEWRAAAAAYGITTLRRGPSVTLQIYCPDPPTEECAGYNDSSSLRIPVAAGLTVRVVHWPHWLSRTILEIGTGAYYGEWKELPPYDTERPAVFTGYRLATLGVRVTRHVGAVIGATQFRNVQHRDDHTSSRIGVQVSWR